MMLGQVFFFYLGKEARFGSFAAIFYVFFNRKFGYDFYPYRLGSFFYFWFGYFSCRGSLRRWYFGFFKSRFSWFFSITKQRSEY